VCAIYPLINLSIFSPLFLVKKTRLERQGKELRGLRDNLLDDLADRWEEKKKEWKTAALK